MSYIPFALSFPDQLIDACCESAELEEACRRAGALHDAVGECQLYVDAKDWPARRLCPRSPGAGGCRAAVEFPSARVRERIDAWIASEMLRPHRFLIFTHGHS